MKKSMVFAGLPFRAASMAGQSSTVSICGAVATLLEIFMAAPRFQTPA
ncbi:MAG TPA: hypothetical protein VFC39_21075 [Acidobacteriaceae bacterium]|nr:hypothetical protein [Acidobacteriaceae bacterium]